MTDINYFLQHPNYLIKFTHYRKHNSDNIITGIAVIAKQSRFWEHNEKYKSMIFPFSNKSNTNLFILQFVLCPPL